MIKEVVIQKAFSRSSAATFVTCDTATFEVKWVSESGKKAKEQYCTEKMVNMPPIGHLVI